MVNDDDMQMTGHADDGRHGKRAMGMMAMRAGNTAPFAVHAAIGPADALELWRGPPRRGGGVCSGRPALQ